MATNVSMQGSSMDKTGQGSTMVKSFTIYVFSLFLFGLLAGCGADAFQSGGTTGGGTVGDTSSVASIELLASTPSLGTGGSGSVTLTAIVKDGSNKLLEGETIAFSSTGGALQVTSGTTTSTGVATAVLTTSGDPTNRIITVSATVAGTTVSDSVDITVSGTAITISGTNTIAVGDSTDLTIFLKDSTNTGIPNQAYTISSSDTSIASLASSTSSTNNSGQAIVTVNGVSAGTATITVTALGLTQTYSVTVTNDTFALTAPTAAQEVDINTIQTVSLTWTASGVAQSGKTINFSSTRGTLSPASTTTDGSGVASVTITSNNIGPATLRATDVSTGLTTSVDFEFVVPAANASSLDLQADKTTIGPSGGQSVLSATVRDPSNNLVKNVDVVFSITQDNSGGSITNATDTTSSLGRASTIYSSTAATTAKDGVHIHAQVNGKDCAITPNLCDDIYLTVAQSQLFITLGTSNLMSALDTTRYQKEWNVLVTDASGNAVANTEVGITIIPTYYRIGYYYKETCPTGSDPDCESGWYEFTGYAGDATATPPIPAIPDPRHTCINEDFSRDGVLDSGEDLNNNTILDPRNVVTVAGTVTTDSTGYGIINVIWGKNYSKWAIVKLTATASVAGTEASASTEFTLPVLASDVSASAVSIPNQVSPWYGEVYDNSSVPSTSNCFRDVNYVPQNVAAIPTATAGQIDIQWDDLKGASSYNIYWDTDSGAGDGTTGKGSGSSGTKITGVTSPYSHTGLTPGWVYYYVVTAVINGQETAISSEASATAP